MSFMGLLNVVAWSASLAAAATPGGERVLLDRIVATVNEDIITLSELKRSAGPFLAQNETPAQRKRLYEDVLGQLINEKLFAQQVKEARITVTENEVTASIEDILQRNGLTREQLLEALEARGRDLEDYRAELKQQLVQLKLLDIKVRSRIFIPETDVRAEYELLTRDEPAKVKVELSDIFLRFDEGTTADERAGVVETAQAARARIVSGAATFEEIAKEVSQGPTASKGGRLGDLEVRTLYAPFANAIADLEPGQVSEVFRTSDGVHIVKLERRWEEKARSYEEMKDRIREQLLRERTDEQTKIWLDEVKRSSAVDIRLDGLE